MINTKSNEFEGSDYDSNRDHQRLSGQIKRVWDVMKDENWRTLSDIESSTGDPQASISAQLRHLRKPKWGSHTLEKRNHGSGTWEYRLICNPNAGDIIDGYYNPKAPVVSGDKQLKMF